MDLMGLLEQGTQEAVQTMQEEQAVLHKALAVELNQDHTVGHLRAFVAAQGAGGAPYDLLAGFPPKPLVDAAQTVGAAGLGGGAVSQKLRA